MGQAKEALFCLSKLSNDTKKSGIDKKYKVNYFMKNYEGVAVL